jgi:predicted ATPase
MPIGRDVETATIDRLIDEARSRRSGVLVVRGQAGIGTSVLLEHAVARAERMRILTGVEQ